MTEVEELCAYCIVTALTGEEKPEHPIPAALGSSLTVPTVCDPCNEWAGREIDQPFLADQLLREHRSMADQRDPRRGAKARRTRSQILQGHTAEGDYIAFDHELGWPVMGSRIVELGEDRSQIRAGSQAEADRLLEIVRKRAAAEGKEARIEAVEHGQARPEITARMMMRTDVWRREAAKIGLAVGSLVYPPAWRLSVDAALLREWMHNRDASTEDGAAPPLVPGGLELGVELARDREHLLLFKQGPGRVTELVIVLFGRAAFGVPVDTSGAPAPTIAWRLDWRNPKADGTTTSTALFMDAAERQISAQIS
jgi:hypothetical protein